MFTKYNYISIYHQLHGIEIFSTLTHKRKQRYFLSPTSYCLFYFYHYYRFLFFFLSPLANFQAYVNKYISIYISNTLESQLILFFGLNCFFRPCRLVVSTLLFYAGFLLPFLAGYIPMASTCFFLAQYPVLCV